MKGVATYMAARELPNQIGGRQLNRAIAGLFEAIPDEVSRRAPTIRNEVRTPLKTRMADSDERMVLERVQVDVRACGILVDDPATPGAFRFGHKSFMEYLFAEVVGDLILDPDEPDSPSILGACNARPGQIAQLPESTKFLSEVLGTDRVRDSKGKSGELDMARRILRLMLGESSVEYWLGRLRLYDASLLKLWVTWPLALKICLPAPLFGMSLAPATLFVSWWLVREPVTVEGTLVLIAVVVSGLVAGIAGVVTARVTGLAGRDRRLLAWNRICHELGFDDRILFRVAGVGWLPGTRRRRFDLFSEGHTQVGWRREER